MPRINLLFVLIMFLSACSAKSTPSPAEPPSTEAPTAPPSATAEDAIVISMEPAGYKPISESTQQGIREFFTPLSVDDVKQLNLEDQVIPDSLAARDAEITKEMLSKKDKVAQICGVPVKYLGVVWKAHVSTDPATGNKQYRWTRVYEAVIPEGEEIPSGVYTCWTRDTETGTLNTYPTVWDANGKLEVNDGNCFERLEGEMKWSGTTPVIYNSKTKKFAIPGGGTNDDFLNESSWMSLENRSVSESVNPIANPFSAEIMAKISESGYTYRADGSLVNASGNVAVSNVNGKWFDGGGAEFDFQTFRIIETDGVDYQNRPLVVLSFTVNGEERVSLPSGESAVPIDLSASRAMVDENAMTNPTAWEWGTFENITFDRIPVVTQESVDSGMLDLTRAMILRPWTDEIRPAVWKYVPINSEAGIWTLTHYRDSGFELGNYSGGPQYPGEDPIVWQNEAIVPSDVVKYIDESTGKWVINSGIQYYYNKATGESLIFKFEYTDERADPNSSDFRQTIMGLGNPSWVVVLPRITQNEAISPELRAKIEKYQGKTQVGSDVTGVVLAGDELAQYQEFTFVPLNYLQRSMEGYLTDPDDPEFDSKYPPLNP
ncbi:MAG: hypothetical protein ABI904_00295 [Chloroflexota bacterium]